MPLVTHGLLIMPVCVMLKWRREHLNSGNFHLNMFKINLSWYIRKTGSILTSVCYVAVCAIGKEHRCFVIQFKALSATKDSQVSARFHRPCTTISITGSLHTLITILLLDFIAQSINREAFWKQSWILLAVSNEETCVLKFSICRHTCTDTQKAHTNICTPNKQTK